MVDLILVDFDDTLVETAPAFRQAREALFAALAADGFPREDSYRVHHREVDPVFLARYGMGPFRMEPAFRETYLQLCRETSRRPDPGVVEACGALGREFLGKPRVMEGTLEALQALAEGFPTAIFSQSAQPEYQMNRIPDAGFANVLDPGRILITDRKTPRTFRQALGIGRSGTNRTGSPGAEGHPVR